MHEKWKRHYVLDVETDGEHPLDFNMINFGLVNVYDLEGVYIDLAPIHDNNGGLPDARAISGISWEEHLTYQKPEIAMKACIDWINSKNGGDFVTIWSDNPAFDWSFFNTYMRKFYPHKPPTGFSARRIGDLFAGYNLNPFDAKSWKKHRITKHTHNPLDDARGNAEALRWIIQEIESKKEDENEALRLAEASLTRHKNRITEIQRLRNLLKENGIDHETP